MKRLLSFFALCVMCLTAAFAQVKVLYETYSTKYYESSRAATPPADDWYATDFDDSSWKDYTGEMTFPEYDAFWVRSVVYITDEPQNHSFSLQYAHDDEARIYVNGNLVHGTCGSCGRYCGTNVPSDYLVKGRNVIAMYTNDNGGGEQYLEFGLSADTDGIIQSYPLVTTLFLSQSNEKLFVVDNDNFNQKSLTADLVSPTGRTGASIVWTSSNENVATVSNGLVKAVGVGTTTITASATYEGTTYTKTCEVAVGTVPTEGKVVFVDTPGTLGTLLTDDEKENTDMLTVYGSLNGDDVDVLRFMAGRTTSGGTSAGELSELDLSEVSFVNDGTSYHYYWDNNNGTYTISSNAISQGMFSSCLRLQKIIMPRKVTTIGDYAFIKCTNLESVIFPDAVASMGYNTFYGCTSLESVTIPASVKSLGGSVFYSCSNLKTVLFEQGSQLTNIPNEFVRSTSVKSIIIPASVTSIDGYAFFDSNPLAEIKFEDESQLKTIGMYAFDNIWNLTSFNLPASVETIGERTFENCNSLKEFNISEDSKLNSVGSNAFNNCPFTSFYIPKDMTSISDIGLNTSSITSITVHPENKFFEESAGIVFAKKEKRIAFVPSSISGALTLPNYITKITDSQFQNCTGLTSITLSEKVTKIGSTAFTGCTGLGTIISLATTPPSLSDNAFDGITPANIQLFVPESAVDTYKAADQWSSFNNIIGIGDAPVVSLNVTKATLFDNGNTKFSTKQLKATIYTASGLYDGTVTWTSCDETVATVDENGLVRFVGPGSATIIATATVNGVEGKADCMVTCTSQEEGVIFVTTAGTLSELISEDDKYDLKQVRIAGQLNDDDMKVLRFMAGRDTDDNISGCQLEKLDLSDAQLSCDVYFRECDQLKEITLPSTMTRLGSWAAFQNCDNLETVILPANLTYIESSAFESCPKLESIDLPSTLTKLGNSAFSNCTSLSNVDFTQLTRLTEIGSWTFNNTALTSVTIPENITKINNYAFNSSKVSSVTFESDATLTTIADWAFCGCKLTSIDIPTSVRTIGTRAFYGCSNLQTMNIPTDSKLTSIGDYFISGTAVKKLYIPQRVVSFGSQDFSSIETIEINPSNTAIVMYDDCLVTKNDKTLRFVPKNKAVVTMPDYVTKIGDGVLQDHVNMETLVLPATLTTFGSNSPFSNCNKLSEIYSLNTVPPTVENDNCLTCNLNNTYSINVYVSEESLNAYQETDWRNFNLVGTAFKDGFAFTVDTLQLVNAYGGRESKLNYLIQSSNGIAYQAKVTYTSSNPSVATVSEEGNVTFAGAGNTYIVGSVTINDVVYKDTCLVMTQDVTDPEYAYYLTGNGNLRSYITNEQKASIKKMVLVGKAHEDDYNMIREMSLEYLDLSALSDTILTSSCLSDCGSLKTLQLPSGLKQIDCWALNNCSNISSLILPATLHYISWNVFYNMSSLQTIVVRSEKVPSVYGSAFDGMNSSCCFIVPAGTGDAYKAAETWKDRNIYDTSALPMLTTTDTQISLYDCDDENVNQKQLTITAITEQGIITPTVTWSSSDANVVTVSADGLVKCGTKDGTATITATYTADNGKKATLDFTVRNVDLAGGVMVYVKTAGTLSTLLTDDQKDNLKSLVVTGNLNSYDIRVLRYMAGRDEYDAMTVGMLETLDMSGANIVDGGGDGYLYRDSWWRSVSNNYIGEQIFANCTSLKKVILPNTLTQMSWNAFDGCTNLEEVVLPDALYNLSSSTFTGCTKLTKVNIPSSLQKLSDGMFRNCTSLTHIDLSNATSLTAIESGCFNNSGLTSIEIPASVITIGNSAFSNCKLESVTFAEGSKLRTMDSYVFYNNTNLTSVTLPDELTTIPAYTFQNDTQLREVKLGENSKLSAIGDYAFDGCALTSFYVPRRLYTISTSSLPSTMESVTVNADNKMLSSHDGALYNAAGDSLIYVPQQKASLTLNSTTAKIASDAFNGCSSLENIFCLLQTPPTATASTLGSLSTTCTVYIPEGKLAAYEKTDWKNLSLVELGADPVISLNKSSIRFYNVDGGNTPVTLSAKILSATGIRESQITWSSSDENVATVSQEGVVSIGTQSGDAVITATTTIDGKTLIATCSVTTTIVDANTSVYFVSAGNLSSMITDEEKANIKDVVLLGTLNGSDIRFLREWAGCSYWSYEGNSDNNGTLKSIDMSGASLVSGGNEVCYGRYINEDGNQSDIWSYTQNNVIGNNFFAGSNSLEKIVLPENIITICDYAFRNSSNLQTISIPRSVKVIGSYAFDNCTGLTGTFTIPASVDSIGYRALAGYTLVHATTTTPCKVAGEIVGDDGIVIVPAEALSTYRQADGWKDFASRIFADDIDFKTDVDIAVTAAEDHSGIIDAIGSDDALAFIQNLKLSGTINSYDIFAIRNRMPRLQSLDLSDVSITASPYEYYTGCHTEVHRLGQSAFRELKNLRSVILPKEITYIGGWAFNNCTNLRSVKMYDKVTTIDNDAFSYCYNLKNVEMQEGVLSLGSSAFNSCNQLEEITLPKSIHSIGEWAFYNTALRNIILPENLTEVKYYTFYNCFNLETVTMPSKVRSIDYYAFANCNKLRELRIPPMVETIGDRAFESCNNIKDVYVYIANPEDTKIDMNTFSCWTTATLHIPNFSYNAYYYDTQWGQFYTKVEFTADYESFYTKNTLQLNEETGVINGNPDATLYENGGLEVENETQNLSEVELKSDGTDGASLIPTGDGKITAKDAKITINVTGYKWHFFCFPFDIARDSISYDGEYVWRRYDGAIRSRHEGGWQDLDENWTKLEKGRGYIFQGTETGELTLHLGTIELTETDQSTEVESNTSDNAADAGWNFIGNPYTSYYNVTDETYDSPVTVWTGSQYEAYRPGDDDYSFAPYQAFFIQAEEDGNVNFSSENQSSYNESKETLKQVKARRRAKKLTPERLLVNLQMNSTEEEQIDSITGEVIERPALDKTRVVFNDSKSITYEPSCDASKFTGDMSKVDMYTLDKTGTHYAINERPVGDGCVALGITVREAGTYCITAPRTDCKIWLKDNMEGVSHDLTTGGYIFDTEKGTFENRFTIQLDNSATNIDEFMAKTGINLTTEQGITVSGATDNLVTNVYSIDGKLMGTITGNGSVNVNDGIYIVKVGLMTVKISK